jgi:hypothetical protein
MSSESGPVPGPTMIPAPHHPLVTMGGQPAQAPLGYVVGGPAVAGQPPHYPSSYNPSPYYPQVPAAEPPKVWSIGRTVGAIAVAVAIAIAGSVAVAAFDHGSSAQTGTGLRNRQFGGTGNGGFGGFGGTRNGVGNSTGNGAGQLGTGQQGTGAGGLGQSLPGAPAD